MYLMWRHACASGLVDEAVDARFRAYKGARMLSTAAVFLSSIPIAFASPIVAQLWWGLVVFAGRATMRWLNVKADD